MKRYELSLADYWMIIRKRKLVIILSFACMLGGSVFYFFHAKPIYEATATIRIADRKTTIEVLPSISVPVERYIDPVKSEAKAILGLPVLKQVAFELGLVDENAAFEKIIGVVKGLQSSIHTEVVKDTNVVKIIVRHPNAEQAAAIANTTAKAYVKEDLNQNIKQAKSVREDIDAQLESVTTRLKEREEEILELKKSGKATGIVIALQDQLADLETKKGNLLTKYTKKHPEVVGITEQIASIKERLKALPEDEITLARATREIDALGKVYKDLVDKLSQARIAEAENVEEVQIIEPAVVPTRPVNPNLPLTAGIGAGAGIILGFLLAFLVENLDTSLIAIEAVEELTKLSVLGMIPFIKRQKKKEKGKQSQLMSKERPKHMRHQLVISQDLESIAAEAFRILRTNIQLKIESKKRNLILVTSSTPQEGKTVIVANLAIVMAQNKFRTLLIDADLRRPVLHSLFGIERKPGLTDVLMDNISLEDSTKTITDILTGEIGWTEVLKVHDLDYLHILTSGSPVSNPAELFSLDTVTKFVNEVRARYDIVLFDSPPVLLVTDATLLGSKTDGVIIVYRVAKTAKNALLRTKEQLQVGKAALLGIVLNNVKPQINYYPPHQYKYYKSTVDEGAVS